MKAGNKYKSIVVWGVCAILMLPILGHAAGVDGQDLLRDLLIAMNNAIPFVLLTEFIVFLITGIRLAWNAGSESGRQKWSQVLTYSGVALFVTVSMWGLIAIIQNTLSVRSGGSYKVPRLNEDISRDLSTPLYYTTIVSHDNVV